MDWSLIISLVSLIGTSLVFVLSRVYNLGSHAKKIELLDKSVDSLLKDMKDVREDMIRVQAVLALKHKGVNEVFSMKHSPRTLNELGNKMYNEMNGASFLESNKDFLFSKIDALSPQTALDVEQHAQWVCSAFVNESIFNPIKDFVYNCPMITTPDDSEIEFTLDSACYILGLKLRDLYLDAHPQLLPEAV